MSDFRATIKAEIDRRGMSVSALAESAGVHRGRLSQWLNDGEPDLRVSAVAAVCAVLGLTLRAAGGSRPTARARTRPA